MNFDENAQARNHINKESASSATGGKSDSADFLSGVLHSDSSFYENNLADIGATATTEKIVHDDSLSEDFNVSANNNEITTVESSNIVLKSELQNSVPHQTFNIPVKDTQIKTVEPANIDLKREQQNTGAQQVFAIPAKETKIAAAESANITLRDKQQNSVLRQPFDISSMDEKITTVEAANIALQKDLVARQHTLPENKGYIRLQDAIAYSVKWHPVIKRSERELEQSREYINEAQSSYYPSLNAHVKSGFEENEFTGRNDNSNALVFSASQVIYDFDKTGSKVRLANSSLNRNVHNLDKSISDIIYETANSYLQTIRYQWLKDIAQKQIEGLSAINDIAKKRANLGASAESDYSQSKVRLASAIASLHDYEAQAERWSSVLDSMTNKYISPHLVRQFPKNIGSICQNYDTKSVMSPAIAMAHAQIEMAKEQVSAAKAEYFPTISLNPSYEYQLDNYNNNNNNNVKKGTWGVFVNVSVPIYEGGSKVSRTRQSEQALYAAQYNLQQEKTEATRRINESVSQITGMRDSLQAKIIREKEALKTRDLYKLQYIELGNRSFSDLLSAESEIHQTRMDIVNTDFSMSTLAIDCLYYSGRLSSYFKGKEGKE